MFPYSPIYSCNTIKGQLLSRIPYYPTFIILPDIDWILDFFLTLYNVIFFFCSNLCIQSIKTSGLFKNLDVGSQILMFIAWILIWLFVLLANLHFILYWISSKIQTHIFLSKILFHFDLLINVRTEMIWCWRFFTVNASGDLLLI